jgi:DNA-binding XRE family transcriptional regulator
MDRDKKKRLEKAGWKVGNTQEFLGLNDAEMAMVNIRVSLAKELRQRRLRRKISQANFAKRIGSSQSRVAKMERGDPSVSLTLLTKSLLMSGSTQADIGRVIGGVPC